MWRQEEAGTRSTARAAMEAPAPRSGNVISPQLFRRYGYFEGEFPLPIVGRAP